MRLTGMDWDEKETIEHDGIILHEVFKAVSLY